MSPADLQLQEVPGGVRMRLRVVPGARRDAVLGTHGEALRVAVRAAPEKGKANDAVGRLLAETLGLGRGDVELVAGHGGRDKAVVVRGLDAAGLRARIATLLGAS